MNPPRLARIFTCAVSILAAVVFCRAAEAAAFSPVLINGAPAHPTRLLAKVKPVAQASAHASALATQGLRTARGFDLVPGLVVLDADPQAQAMAAAASAGSSNAAPQAAQLQSRLAALRASGLFEYVEPDCLYFADAAPNDAAFANGTLWGLRNTGQDFGTAGADIDAVRAWEITTGSRGVIVAVIDSGIRSTHQDLAANMWHNPGETAGNGKDDDRNGYIDDVFGVNAITGSGDTEDDVGHGTHVAGTIGAAANNGGPLVGVAWQVQLMACKFLGAQNGGTTSDAIACIEYAVQHGASVLNCSWGGTQNSAALHNALAAARDRNVVVVAAAGNDGVNVEEQPHYPSSFDLDYLVAVAAIDRRGQLASFSNRGGTSVDVGAPGVDIYSALNTTDVAYGSADGTSMAAPHVSGVAALIRARFPALSGTDVRDVIVNTATATPALQFLTVAGGRVNAYTALTAVSDGILELHATPGPEATLFAGRAASLAVRVTDLTAVRGATVTGSLPGGAVLTFRDDGAAPDVIANDGTYTATFSPLAGASTATIGVTATAPGKVAATKDFAYIVVPPPENDDFAQRTVLTGKRTGASGSNFGGTREAGESSHVGTPGGASVWWTWTAPANTTVTVTTEHSLFDTVLAVYTGNALNALQLVAANDDVPGETLRHHSRVEFAATAGTAYQIAVDGVDGATGSITLALTTSIVASNDMFASATAIAGASASATGNLFNATREPGEPDHGSASPGGSVWWSWTVPSSGTARISSTSGLVALYTGSSVAALTPVPGARESGNVFSAAAGTTYRIAVSALLDTYVLPDDFTLSASLSTPPANDAFANRAVLTGASAHAEGSTTDATLEAGEPDHGSASVWWTWTAPSTGSAVLTINRPFHERRIVIYRGSSLSSLSAVASNHGSSFSVFNSRAVFYAEAGTVYQIAVGGQRGDFTFDLEVGANPANDNFANRIAISGATVSVVGNNRGATREAIEPVPTAYGTGATLWWSWTAPTDGTVTIASNTGYMAVYVGSAIDNLTRLNATLFPITTSEVFHAVGGTTYHIWVDGVFGYIGDFTITVTLRDGPTNDAFSQRRVLQGANVTVDATLKYATPDLGGPSWSGNSVWWTWTAPASSRTQVTTVGADWRIAVATGDSLAALSRVADGSGRLEAVGNFVFNAQAGVTYQIAVDGDPAEGTQPFQLKLAQGPAPVNDMFASTASLAGATIAVSTTNVGATAETSEPPQINPRASTSLWWTWTAPTAGVVTIDTAGSDFNTRLAVYAGSALGSLTTVAANDDAAAGNISSRVVFGAAAGEVFRVAVDGVLHTTGNVVLNLALDPPVSNDAFANRIPLLGPVVSVEANNLGATREPAESALGGAPLTGTVWWTWKAPSTGLAVARVTSDAVIPELSVYTGPSLASLRRVENLQLFFASRETMFRAAAGTTYVIRVGSVPGQAGPFALSVSFHNPPANDDFARSTMLVGAAVSGSTSSQFSTRETGEPLHAQLPVTSVWWTWVAPVSGTVRVDTAGSKTGAIFSVYTGSTFSTLTPVVSSMQSPNGVYVDLAAVAGTTYHIAIGHATGLGGDVCLNIRNGQRPANDDFAGRVPITGLDAAETGHNRDATTESGEPSHVGVTSGASVWWTWTAPLSSRIGLSTAGSTLDTLLAVYAGTGIGTLVPIAGNDDSGPGVRTSQVIFQATQGRTYQIVVAGKNGGMGAISLRLSTVEPPIANAVQASGTTVAADGNLLLTASAFGPGKLRYQWLLNGVEIPGATQATYTVRSVQAPDAGSYSVRISNEFGTTTSLATTIIVDESPASNARLTNLSTRALGLTGDNVLIPGFVIAGPGNKQLLIRAVGPTLAGFGIAGVLPDPRLALKRFNGSGYDNVVANDNWATNTNIAVIRATAAQLFAFPLVEDSNDAALLVDLAPGQYSVVADDVGAQTGIAIVELYDADDPAAAGSTSRLINISNRGFVGTGDNIMIPGFVVSDEGPKTLLIRVVGPTLGQAPYNVAGVLADPTLSIYRHDSVHNTDELILTNDDWSTGPGAQRTRDVAAQVFAFALPEGSNDAAFVVTLNPGVYTVHARGANDTTGVALVEVYAVP